MRSIHHVIKLATTAAIFATLTLGCDTEVEDGPSIEERQAQLDKQIAGYCDAEEKGILLDLNTECDQTTYSEETVLGGVGGSEQECLQDIVESQPAWFEWTCSSTAWNPGNCLEPDCGSDSAQCVGDPGQSDGTPTQCWSWQDELEYHCLCTFTVTCGCMCEGCTPDPHSWNVEP